MSSKKKNQANAGHTITRKWWPTGTGFSLRDYQTILGTFILSNSTILNWSVSARHQKMTSTLNATPKSVFHSLTMLPHSMTQRMAFKIIAQLKIMRPQANTVPDHRTTTRMAFLGIQSTWSSSVQSSSSSLCVWFWAAGSIGIRIRKYWSKELRGTHKSF